MKKWLQVSLVILIAISLVAIPGCTQAPAKPVAVMTELTTTPAPTSTTAITTTATAAAVQATPTKRLDIAAEDARQRLQCNNGIGTLDYCLEVADKQGIPREVMKKWFCSNSNAC
nr:hypothetical protein [uncultured Methanoregula sp.]